MALASTAVEQDRQHRNTSVTIKVTPVADVTLLVIHILGIQSSAATVVHLTAIAP